MTMLINLPSYLISQFTYLRRTQFNAAEAGSCGIVSLKKSAIKLGPDIVRSFSDKSFPCLQYCRIVYLVPKTADFSLLATL